ncbi:hypothetical protein SAMN04488028_107205 [Reichenbachiella agariperforans]|uniref:Uncharacterized protein n=1 Tax=Reichenbachiella agariperforans TaxID=156994 RepID=A0A1M6UNP8_REIAG|nr:hypothetical protein [Reichenbachiella agariperforans]SHK70787.1 hypothetical protein SAMN04488028_107205 [Reichenbachiella agariperforans]
MKTNPLIASSGEKPNYKKFNTESDKSFKKIFQNKGSIAPIAEKACKNFEIKSKSPVNRDGRLHYFSVGHAFKNIDSKNVFRYELDESQMDMKPTQFLALQKEFFDFQGALNGLLKHIRNVNSHYVHTFEKLEIQSINQKLITFLIEAFELAVIHSYLNEEELSYEAYKDDPQSGQKLVQFLCDKFYPNKEHEVEERKTILAKNKRQALEHLLFIEVTSDIDWKLFEKHKVFTISNGKYLSFHACLFLLSLFLYKSEANQLISKIKGFKRNDDNQYRSKRQIFTFFSKKFTSQDVNSEEQHLVKFRDVIQYLNHYPSAWNKHLELKSGYPQMTDKLMRYIVEAEIYRSFPDQTDNHRFLLFAIREFFGQSCLDTWTGNTPINFSNQEQKGFSYEINTSAEIKDIETKLKALVLKGPLNFKEKKEQNRLEKDLRREKKEQPTNRVKEKLLTRIQHNMLYVSYGRNQDRFMDFAARFLAETDYFGKDAKFKMYQFYTSDEQRDHLKEQKKELPKKEFEKLKYHQSKLVDYFTYAEQQARYPDWDTPFVVENNAIQIKVTLFNGAKKIVSVQRNLMLYLLEDALYSEKRENAGKGLISGYFVHHQKELKDQLDILEKETEISREQKREFKKLLPKRLLHRYSPAQINDTTEWNPMEVILEEAKAQEQRYQLLLEKAILHQTEEDFLKRNKGKQFKLRFVRKAWHLMYLKELYMNKVAEHGHHKSFHITKEEFNDFCRWMFAFDEVPKYKEYLCDYFSQKGFFNNAEFKDLIESSTSLNDLYEKTKQRFEGWSKDLTKQSDENKYLLANYESMLKDDMLYVNISHFISYLESKGKINRNAHGHIAYKALNNVPHLIEEYYYKDRLAPEEYKSHGKLYNKLKTVKLEDALLYEMAMHYLSLEPALVPKVKTKVKDILSSNIAFDIKDAAGHHLYHLLIPFHKIDSFVALINHQSQQEKDPDKTSFLAKIQPYLEKVKNSKDLKAVYHYYKDTPHTLRYEDLNMIHSHIVSQSVQFTKVALKLEEYFIAKKSITLQIARQISYSEIADLSNYFTDEVRNTAFHFDVPETAYSMILQGIESEFLDREIKPQKPKSLSELSTQQVSVCTAFLETLHNNLFDRKDDKKERLSKARERYFEQIN